MLWSHILGPGMVPRVADRLNGPCDPVHRSKASDGRDWVSPRGPQASLGSFRRSARTLALAVTREGGLSSTDERVRGHVTEVTQALQKSSKWSPRRPPVQ